MPTLALPLEDYLESGNKSSPRGSSHGLDSLIAGQNRSKKIQNWMGYKALGRRWQASNNIGRAVSVAHAGLGYSTQWAWDSGPQQLYVASQPSQAPQGGMVKAAVAHRPDLWVSSAVVNAVNGVVPTRTDTSVTHVNLMPEGGTKHVDIGPEKYVEKYSYPGMPSEVPRVAYAVPDGCTIERTANGRALRFLDADGVQYMHTQDAYGWWGTAEVSLLIQNTGGVELVPQGTQLILGRTYHIFDLVPVAAEWAASFGQVHIDPSVTLSGTTDLEDSVIHEGIPNGNFGAFERISAGELVASPYNDLHGLMRIASGIPDGTITLTRLDIYRNANANSTKSGTIDLYECLRPWVEGVSLTGTDSRWTHYTTTLTWQTAGAEGALDRSGTAGASQAFSSFTSGSDTLVQITLPNSWAVVGNGWVTRGRDEGGTSTDAGKFFQWRGIDYLTDPTKVPEIYIEYTAPSTGNPHYYYNMLKRRR